MKALAAYPIAMVTAHAELCASQTCSKTVKVVAGLEHGAVRHNPTDEQCSSMLKCKQYV